MGQEKLGRIERKVAEQSGRLGGFLLRLLDSLPRRPMYNTLGIYTEAEIEAFESAGFGSVGKI